MDLGLANKCVLVAGSSRGIGYGIAEAFLDEGARVLVTGRTADSLDAANRSLSVLHPGRVAQCCADLTDAAGAQLAVEQVLATWNELHVLVANVGSGKGTRGWTADDSEWDRMLQLNLLGAVRLVRAAVPALQRTSGASILFVASIAGVEHLAAPLAYSAAKAALLALTKSLAVELAPFGIRVNAIAPGNVLFEGGSWAQRLAADRETTERYIRDNVPLARFGTPAEVGASAAFICSERAAFITGSCFVVDGGQTKSF